MNTSPPPDPSLAETPMAATRQWAPLVIAWLVVLVPAAWGITQTVLKSLALFR
jgi:hypothetical protein